MAPERSLTPEKQLLKLIETPKASSAATVGAHAAKHQSLSFLSISAWLGRLSFFKDRSKGWFKGGWQEIDVRVVNAVLMIIIAVLIGYFALNLFVSVLKLGKIPELKLKLHEVAGMIDPREASALRAASYYSDKISQRNIFKLGQQVEVAAIDDGAKATTAAVIEATAHLKLVGISWSNNPDAMIEDTKALRTHFIKTGQMIGDVKVMAIFKDKIILSYQGDEIELK